MEGRREQQQTRSERWKREEGMESVLTACVSTHRHICVSLQTYTDCVILFQRWSHDVEILSWPEVT